MFNRNKKGVRISSIRFKDSATPFSLNVDGVSGTSFGDVEIRGGDSIFVFIESFIRRPRLWSLGEWRISWSLSLTVSHKEVEVEAWAQNVTRLKGERITADTRLTPKLPYLVFDSAHRG